MHRQYSTGVIIVVQLTVLPPGGRAFSGSGKMSSPKPHVACLGCQHDGMPVQQRRRVSRSLRSPRQAPNCLMTTAPIPTVMCWPHKPGWCGWEPRVRLSSIGKLNGLQGIRAYSASLKIQNTAETLITLPPQALTGNHYRSRRPSCHLLRKLLAQFISRRHCCVGSSFRTYFLAPHAFCNLCRLM